VSQQKGSGGGRSGRGAKGADSGDGLWQVEHAASEDLATEALDVARVWEEAYTELVELEERLLARIRELLPEMSPTARREAELSDVPMLVQHLQAFKYRRALWRRRVGELSD
jgi:hypothetical protein